MISRDLPAELTANAAACPGDHHHLVLHQLPNAFRFEIDAFASQQILDFHRAYLGSLYHPVNHLFHGRNRFKSEMHFIEHLYHLAYAPSGSTWHSDHGLIRLNFAVVSISGRPITGTP